MIFRRMRRLMSLTCRERRELLLACARALRDYTEPVGEEQVA